METNNNKMSFEEALKILNIEDYADRIFNSNSHGELFHLYDYIVIAQLAQKKDMTKDFRKWFVGLVEWAEKNWTRPDSIFQHIIKCMIDSQKS